MHTASQLSYPSVTGDNNSIPQSIWEELFLVTNPAETLYPEGMTPLKTPSFEDVPENAKLQTIHWSREAEKMKKSNSSLALYSQSLLEYSYREDEHLAHTYATIKYERQMEAPGQAGVKQPLHGTPEAVIALTYHRPQYHFGKADKRGKPSTSIHLLTHNTLLDIREAIKCPKDFEIPGDFSHAPDGYHIVKPAKDIYTAALFFIEGVFYIDRRTLKVQDYSKPIIDWLIKKGCTTKEFPVRNMSKTKLRDMEIKLGMPYVYMHQGNCEHIIQFTDIRLMTSDDCQHVNAYPVRLSLFASKFAICNSCHQRAVTWMVSNSTISASDPSHYCDVCFKMFHYDAKGEKVCDFQAYRYTDNAFNVI